MSGYEQIGSWQVSLAIPAEVRDLFREQTADLLSQQPSSWVRRYSNSARHSLLECLLVGGTMFIPPDPFYDPQYYLQGSGGDRYEEVWRALGERFAKLDRLRRNGPEGVYLYWQNMLAQVRGDEFVTSLPALVDPELAGFYPVSLRINYHTRAARIEPCSEKDI